MNQRLKLETVKVIEENISSIPQDIDLGKFILDSTPFTKELRPTIDNQYFIKLKSFWKGKETMKKVKKTSETMREYLTVIHRTEGQYSECIKSSTKKKENKGPK